MRFVGAAMLVIVAAVLAGVIFGMAGAAFITAAFSAPPENADPALHDFFENQRIPGVGVSCCSVSDGRAVEYDIRGGHYWVLLQRDTFEWLAPEHEGWRKVDDRWVIRGQQNPTGKAVVWVAKSGHQFGSPPFGSGASFEKDDVMCFLPPSEA